MGWWTLYEGGKGEADKAQTDAMRLCDELWFFHSVELLDDGMRASEARA